MIYSQAIKYVVPVKAKYTKRDVDSLIISSLFAGNNSTLSEHIAKFIIKCHAINNNANYSKYISEVSQ